MSEGTHLSAEVRRRAVRAVQDGMSRMAIAAAVGVERTTLYRWIQKYEVDGESGLERKAGSGRRRKLEELSEDELRALVLKGAQHFGYETDLWTVGRLRQGITEEFSIVLSKNTVWRRLRDAGLTYQKPERASSVSSVGKTYRVEGGHRILATDAQASSSPPLGGCDGPGASSHVQENQSMDRKSAVSSCIPSSQVLARLESR